MIVGGGAAYAPSGHDSSSRNTSILPMDHVPAALPLERDGIIIIGEAFGTQTYLCLPVYCSTVTSTQLCSTDSIDDVNTFHHELDDRTFDCGTS